MIEKKRLFKLAEEIKVEVKEVIAYLKKEGTKRVSAASFVDAAVVQDIKDHFSGKKPQKEEVATAADQPKAEAAKKPEPAVEPEVPAKKQQAAAPPEPAVKIPESVPAAPVDGAKAKVIDREPVPTASPATPMAEPGGAPPIPIDQPAATQQPAAKAPQESVKLSPSTTPATPPKKPGGGERVSPTETIRQHLSRSGQIRPRPFLSRSRQGAPVRPPADHGSQTNHRPASSAKTSHSLSGSAARRRPQGSPQKQTRSAASGRSISVSGKYLSWTPDTNGGPPRTLPTHTHQPVGQLD